MDYRGVLPPITTEYWWTSRQYTPTATLLGGLTDDNHQPIHTPRSCTLRDDDLPGTGAGGRRSCTRLCALRLRQPSALRKQHPAAELWNRLGERSGDLIRIDVGQRFSATGGGTSTSQQVDYTLSVS